MSKITLINKSKRSLSAVWTYTLDQVCLATLEILQYRLHDSV